MATKTVYVQERVDAGDPFSQEMLPTAITGHPYMVHPSPLAVMNESGSGKRLRVKLANLRPLSGPNALTSMLSIQRISAYVGGELVSPEELDSQNPALPSQVTIAKTPSSITITAGGAYRRTMVMSELNPTRALSFLCAQANGNSNSGFDSGEFVKLTADADITGYVLREGQGLAFVYESNGPSHCYAINFRMKNLATGNSYRCSEIVRPRHMSGQSPFCVLNGSGSGIVLEIDKMQIREVGTDEIVLATYEPIEGIMGSECDGTSACAIMANSTDTLPSGVTIRRNCVTARMGTKAGALISSPHLRKVILAEPPYGPGISGGPQIARRGLFSPDVTSEIILEEGQGLGLFLRTAGAQLHHEATMVINIEDVNPTPAEIAEAVWTRAGRTLTA